MRILQEAHYTRWGIAAVLEDSGAVSYDGQPQACPLQKDVGVVTERLRMRIDAILKKSLELETGRGELTAPCLAVKEREAMFRGDSEKRAAVREAISEASKGTFISQAAMDAWIASWDSDAELPSPEPDIRVR